MSFGEDILIKQEIELGTCQLEQIGCAYTVESGGEDPPLLLKKEPLEAGEDSPFVLLKNDLSYCKESSGSSSPRSQSFFPSCFSSFSVSKRALPSRTLSSLTRLFVCVTRKSVFSHLVNLGNCIPLGVQFEGPEEIKLGLFLIMVSRKNNSVHSFTRAA
jgi:hypothetical protein